MNKHIKRIIGDFQKPKEPIYYTSLFQSCGIGEYYLKESLGLIGSVSNEILSKRAQWAKEIYPECNVVCGDILEKKTFKKLVRLHKEKGCAGVMASCACQSYTLANSKRNPSDKRGPLFEPTLKFIKYTIPEWILIENVPQMLTVKLDNGRIVGQYIVEELRNTSYITECKTQLIFLFHKTAGEQSF